jgi:hypothetical protein
MKRREFIAALGIADSYKGRGACSGYDAALVKASCRNTPGKQARHRSPAGIARR